MVGSGSQSQHEDKSDLDDLLDDAEVAQMSDFAKKRKADADDVDLKRLRPFLQSHSRDALKKKLLEKKPEFGSVASLSKAQLVTILEMDYTVKSFRAGLKKDDGEASGSGGGSGGDGGGDGKSRNQKIYDGQVVILKNLAELKKAMERSSSSNSRDDAVWAWIPGFEEQDGWWVHGYYGWVWPENEQGM